jgi:spore coat protein YsxE
MTVQESKGKTSFKPYRNFRSGLLRRVIARYGWNPVQVTRVRGAWRVETEDGTFALKKASCSAKKLSFLHQAVEEVRSQGGDALLPWIPTGKGRPFLEERGRAWYATRWSGGVLDPRDAPAEELIRQLAVLHRLLEKPADRGKEFRYRAGTGLVERWRGHRERIQEYRSKLKTRGFASPFEQMLSDHADLLDKAFSFAVRGMERFVETERGIPPRYTLCHGRIHPHNILKGDRGWIWIDWDHARVDSPVRDLALFFRQFSDPSEGGSGILSLLEVYEQERKLSRKEKKLLALYLAYPDGIGELLRQYRKPGGIAEAEAVRRLRLELDRLRGVRETLGELWPKRSAHQRAGKGSAAKENAAVAAVQSRADKKGNAG